MMSKGMLWGRGLEYGSRTEAAPPVEGQEQEEKPVAKTKKKLNCLRRRKTKLPNASITSTPPFCPNLH